MRNHKKGEASRRTIPKFYFFVEGDTEKLYFKRLNSSDYVKGHASFRVESSGRQPLPLVQEAIKFEQETEIDPNDSIWCVFDVDKHPKLQEAISQAEQNGFKVAVSNPCFELWLSLHDKENNKRGNVSCGSLKSLKKSVLNGPYYSDDAISWACTAASELEENHEKHKRYFPKNNPSSGIFKIFKAIDEIKK